LKDVNQNNRVIGLLVELLDPKVSKIETLDIDEFYGSEEIFTAPNRLKSLRLVSDFVRFEPSCFSALGTSRLERLEFRNSVFTEDQVSEIFKMLPRSSIIDFTLFRCELTSRNWSEFVNALKNCDRFMKSISISAPRTGCNLVELVTAVNQKRYAIAEFMLCIDRIRDAIPIFKPLCQYPRKIGRLVLKNHHWDKIEV
jgi:hypothetical protein